MKLAEKEGHARQSLEATERFAFATSECMPAIDEDGVLPFPSRNPMTNIKDLNNKKGFTSARDADKEFGFEYGMTARHLKKVV